MVIFHNISSQMALKQVPVYSHSTLNCLRQDRLRVRTVLYVINRRNSSSIGNIIHKNVTLTLLYVKWLKNALMSPALKKLHNSVWFHVLCTTVICLNALYKLHEWCGSAIMCSSQSHTKSSGHGKWTKGEKASLTKPVKTDFSNLLTHVHVN